MVTARYPVESPYAYEAEEARDAARFENGNTATQRHEWASDHRGGGIRLRTVVRRSTGSEPLRRRSSVFRRHRSVPPRMACSRSRNGLYHADQSSLVQRSQAAAAAELPAKFKERMDNLPPPTATSDFGSIVHAHSARIRLRGAGLRCTGSRRMAPLPTVRPPRRYGVCRRRALARAERYRSTSMTSPRRRRWLTRCATIPRPVSCSAGATPRSRCTDRAAIRRASTWSCRLADAVGDRLTCVDPKTAASVYRPDERARSGRTATTPERLVRPDR